MGSRRPDFFEDDMITEVVRVVNSGKEGTVYCCRASARTGQELFAAKSYRPPEHRMFHRSAVKHGLPGGSVDQGTPTAAGNDEEITCRA